MGKRGPKATDFRPTFPGCDHPTECGSPVYATVEDMHAGKIAYRECEWCKSVDRIMAQLRAKAALVDELVAAAKLAALNFKRSQASGNFLGDDDQEAWTALRTVLAKAEALK